MLVHHQPARIRLQLDDRTVTTRALMVTVANGPYTGLGLTLAPDARLDDGLLDVRVVERWDRPHAALVVRGRVAESEHLEEYLEETANALAPLLERASLFDRRVQREHDLVAAGERRLLRDERAEQLAGQPRPRRRRQRDLGRRHRTALVRADRDHVELAQPAGVEPGQLGAEHDQGPHVGRDRRDRRSSRWSGAAAAGEDHARTSALDGARRASRR
ncbi:MAG: diacylglycerol kinase family protein, partial [Thermoplasmatota archaeon]